MGSTRFPTGGLVMKKIVIAALTATALVAAPASAAVIFDTETGSGTVGKGDVQTPFGWNNKQLQDNAPGVTFRYSDSASYSVKCAWTTGEGTPGEQDHTVNIPRLRMVNSTIVYDVRRSAGNDQINHFLLTGYGTGQNVGSVPAVGDSCLGIGAQGTVEAVTSLGSTGGALFAVYGGTSHQIN
jgi:hypothetical protein